MVWLLNLFKGVPLENPGIFDAHDILSQVLGFVTFLVFSSGSLSSSMVF